MKPAAPVINTFLPLAVARSNGSGCRVQMVRLLCGTGWTFNGLLGSAVPRKKAPITSAQYIKNPRTTLVLFLVDASEPAGPRFGLNSIPVPWD